MWGESTNLGVHPVPHLGEQGTPLKRARKVVGIRGFGGHQENMALVILMETMRDAL